MELLRCCRCGAFYSNGGNVCPKCTKRDNIELSTFKNYIEKNGIATRFFRTNINFYWNFGKKFESFFKL